MKTSQIISDDHIDDHVDDEIRKCFMSDPQKSFFMFAGAGSGKTRSLINALEFLSAEKSEYLAEHGKKIAVITSPTLHVTRLVGVFNTKLFFTSLLSIVSYGILLRIFRWILGGG